MPTDNSTVVDNKVRVALITGGKCSTYRGIRWLLYLNLLWPDYFETTLKIKGCIATWE
jgi:hypothetical protein